MPSRYTLASVAVLLCCSTSWGREEPGTPPRQGAFAGGAVMVGGYGYRAVDRLLLGGEGAGVFGHGTRGGFGLFTVGYALWSRPKWQVYPFWGFGGGSFTADDRSPGSGFLLGVGVGADVMATKGPRGYTVGARAGYLFRFDDNDLNTFYLGLSFGRSRRR